MADRSRGLTERLVEKPFDRTFHEWMTKAAEGLLITLHAVCAYTESDEISVLLPRDTELFDREVERLQSENWKSGEGNPQANCRQRGTPHEGTVRRFRRGARPRARQGRDHTERRQRFEMNVSGPGGRIPSETRA